mgnify:CR=1 FL=1|tara:strand:+ start:1336 stop:1782 length:447 start_codon:yes stop_codon:yes gene_type:complete
MAVHTYGTTNISFSSFDTWSNNVASDSNVTMNDALGDAVPSNSNPTSASEIYNNNWFYGQLQVSTGGYVDVSATGYSVADATGTTTLKNVNLDESNLTLTADETAAYPRTFVRWRRENSSGAEISTNTVLTLTSADETSTSVFYAEFT